MPVVKKQTNKQKYKQKNTQYQPTKAIKEAYHNTTFLNQFTVTKESIEFE